LIQKGCPALQDERLTETSSWLVDEPIIGWAKAFPSIWTGEEEAGMGGGKSSPDDNLPGVISCDGTSGTSSAKTTAKPL
jgi:hypothetical protein